MGEKLDWRNAIMLRVGISVEGATEREFVNQVMIPYFSVLNVFLTPVPMNGNVSLARIRHIYGRP